jgi:hypothetical protein
MGSAAYFNYPPRQPDRRQLLGGLIRSYLLHPRTSAHIFYMGRSVHRDYIFLTMVPPLNTPLTGTVSQPYRWKPS